MNTILPSNNTTNRPDSNDDKRGQLTRQQLQPHHERESSFQQHHQITSSRPGGTNALNSTLPSVSYDGFLEDKSGSLVSHLDPSHDGDDEEDYEEHPHNQQPSSEVVRGVAFSPKPRSQQALHHSHEHHEHLPPAYFYHPQQQHQRPPQPPGHSHYHFYPQQQQAPPPSSRSQRMHHPQPPHQPQQYNPLQSLAQDGGHPPQQHHRHVSQSHLLEQRHRDHISLHHAQRPLSDRDQETDFEGDSDQEDVSFEPGYSLEHHQQHQHVLVPHPQYQHQPPSNQQSNPFQQYERPPRPQSSHEVHSNNFISEEEFLMLAEDYLLSLSPKKREKALLSNTMYQKILMVLLQPKNTQVSTAQFRFWAKKMFTLSTTETHHIVCHGGKPVATKECLYDVLVYCHRKSSHGGRDKTSAEVRQHYSWVPKELIARFVKHCPLCSSRRHSLQRPLSISSLSALDLEGSFSSSSGMETTRTASSAATGSLSSSSSMSTVHQQVSGGTAMSTSSSLSSASTQFGSLSTSAPYSGTGGVSSETPSSLSRSGGGPLHGHSHSISHGQEHLFQFLPRTRPPYDGVQPSLSERLQQQQQQFELMPPIAPSPQLSASSSQLHRTSDHPTAGLYSSSSRIGGHHRHRRSASINTGALGHSLTRSQFAHPYGLGQPGGRREMLLQSLSTSNVHHAPSYNWTQGVESASAEVLAGDGGDDADFEFGEDEGDDDDGFDADVGDEEREEDDDDFDYHVGRFSTGSGKPLRNDHFATVYEDQHDHQHPQQPQLQLQMQMQQRRQQHHEQQHHEQQQHQEQQGRWQAGRHIASLESSGSRIPEDDYFLGGLVGLAHGPQRPPDSHPRRHPPRAPSGPSSQRPMSRP